MSIETLKEDAKRVIAALPTGITVTADQLSAFMRDNLLPLAESLIEEIGEVDGVVDDLVHQTQEVLHDESAEVFAGIITGGEVLVTELRTRCGNDQRILTLIRAWLELAKRGKQILEDVVVPEEYEDDEDGDGEDGDEDPASPGTASEPAV